MPNALKSELAGRFGDEIADRLAAAYQMVMEEGLETGSTRDGSDLRMAIVDALIGAVGRGDTDLESLVTADRAAR